jgi:hypothetical protein
VERAIPLPPIVTRGLVAVIVALAINALLLAVGRGFLPVPSGFEPMQWRPVLLTTAAGAVGGAVVYALLDRVTTRTDRFFLLVAALVLVVSFTPLVTEFLPRLPTTVVGFVGLLHVVVAVVTVGTLGGRPPFDERTRG